MCTDELEVVHGVDKRLSSPLRRSILGSPSQIWAHPAAHLRAGLLSGRPRRPGDRADLAGGGPVLAPGVRLADACATLALTGRVRPMNAPSRDTILEALAIIRRGGSFGMPLVEFANRWPSRLKEARKTLAGVGQVTGWLVRYGYVQRSSGHRRARFTLTAAGEAFLAEARGS